MFSKLNLPIFAGFLFFWRVVFGGVELVAVNSHLVFTIQFLNSEVNEDFYTKLEEKKASLEINISHGSPTTKRRIGNWCIAEIGTISTDGNDSPTHSEEWEQFWSSPSPPCACYLSYLHYLTLSSIFIVIFVSLLFIFAFSFFPFFNANICFLF
ncbi:uncharacterized protein LOC125419100 isoform X1 [Ziziphus jujuba]|uniref:Uncharacterized protein LOC125419100 isoform X1 n=1 Tax=Ziziphus jujuba TaxID=326968 RepID=A0ABM3I454_ZIZJJ|nr:uncharacterized protein LOC125419100 isoform X1 [Ziziphus jujuba]